MEAKQPMVYLDYAAATPLNREVAHLIHSVSVQSVANPSGITAPAIESRRLIEEARTRIAGFVGALPTELVFTDGATYANNLALAGSIGLWKKSNPNRMPRVITTAIEHASVYEVLRHLEVECVYLTLDEQGRVDPRELRKLLNEQTALVSVGYVNGEIGVVQDIRGIAKELRHYRKHQETTSLYPLFHTDASQATLYQDLNVQSLGVNLMTLSASKIYGPKKTGALVVRGGVTLAPLLRGGDQERGLCPGTEDVASIVGFGHALELARTRLQDEYVRLENLKDFLIHELALDPLIVFNSSRGEESSPHLVNITLPELSAEELVIRLDAQGFVCSTQSACSTTRGEPSRVIEELRKAQGLDQINTGSIRISFGQDTTKEDLERFVVALRKIINLMRNTQKLYS